MSSLTLFLIFPNTYIYAIDITTGTQTENIMFVPSQIGRQKALSVLKQKKSHHISSKSKELENLKSLELRANDSNSNKKSSRYGLRSNSVTESSVRIPNPLISSEQQQRELNRQELELHDATAISTTTTTTTTTIGAAGITSTSLVKKKDDSNNGISNDIRVDFSGGNSNNKDFASNKLNLVNSGSNSMKQSKVGSKTLLAGSNDAMDEMNINGNDGQMPRVGSMFSSLVSDEVPLPYKAHKCHSKL